MQSNFDDHLPDYHDECMFLADYDNAIIHGEVETEETVVYDYDLINLDDEPLVDITHKNTPQQNNTRATPLATPLATPRAIPGTSTPGMFKFAVNNF